MAGGETGVEADVIWPDPGLSNAQFISVNPVFLICKTAREAALAAPSMARTRWPVDGRSICAVTYRQ